MVARIRRLLAPPALADEDQARTARLLNTLLFLVLTLVLVSTPLWPLVYARPWPVLLAAGAAALLLVSCLFLLRRGSIRAVTWLFLATFWLIVSFVAVVSGGVHTTAFFTYGAIILLAGLLAGSWPAFLVAGLSSLAGLGMFFAQRYGLLPPPLLLDTPLSAWVALTVNFAVAAAVLHLATRSIAEALRRAHDNERALAGANEGLQREVAERRLAEEETRHHVDILTALHETALDLAAQRALPDLLRAITARAVDLLRAKGGAIYLYRPASDDLELMLTHRLEPDFSGAVLQRG